MMKKGILTLVPGTEMQWRSEMQGCHCTRDIIEPVRFP
jgi:hypothetical protein